MLGLERYTYTDFLSDFKSWRFYFKTTLSEKWIFICILTWSFYFQNRMVDILLLFCYHMLYDVLLMEGSNHWASELSICRSLSKRWVLSYHQWVLIFAGLPTPEMTADLCHHCTYVTFLSRLAIIKTKIVGVCWMFNGILVDYVLTYFKIYFVPNVLYLVITVFTPYLFCQGADVCCVKAPCCFPPGINRRCFVYFYVYTSVNNSGKT